MANIAIICYDTKRRYDKASALQYVGFIMLQALCCPYILGVLAVARKIGVRYIFDDNLKLQAEGRKNDPTVSLIESPTDGNGSAGSYRTKVGENFAGILHLFDMEFQYEQANVYRKSYGAYLRHNQWSDLYAEVWIAV